MNSIVVLDTGPLGLITNPKPSASALACQRWFQSLTGKGARVIVPEIADYELRRELLRANKTRGVANLDRLITQVEYSPIITAAMRLAAEFWAKARQRGQPTTGDKHIDADAILAAQAATLGVASFVVATTNVKHLSRFIPADLWQNIS